MTQTLTTDELRQIVENDHVQCGDAAAMARELLANREAQPVAEPYMYELWKFDETVPELERWFLVERSHSKLVARKGQKVVILYTAPPAPAVGIPDKVSCEGFDPKDWVEARNLGQCEGWNAYRAELLAQPVSQGYKLPPHAYRELVNSLRDTAVKYSGTDQLRERLNTTLSQFIEPDHPHTRTAAPDRN